MIWCGPVAEKAKELAVKNRILFNVKSGSDSTKWQESTEHSVHPRWPKDILHPQCNSLLLILNVFCLSRRARPINLANKNKSCFRSCLLRNKNKTLKQNTKFSLKFSVFWWMFTMERLHWLWIRTFTKFKHFGLFSLLQSKLLVVKSLRRRRFDFGKSNSLHSSLITQARYVYPIDHVYNIEDPERIFKQSF